MSVKTFITTMPDRKGAFLAASRIIARHGGNILRVSYNKAVDLQTLFIDVEAADGELIAIRRELDDIGYLRHEQTEIRILMIEVRIRDVSGGILPVLELLVRHDINISYMNSITRHTEAQDFVMGLLITDPSTVETFLAELSAIYPVRVLEDDRNLDNTVFYLKFAGEIKRLLGLDEDRTAEFLSEATRTMQQLHRLKESPEKVFDYIRQFARFVAEHRGEAYRCEIFEKQITPSVTLYQLTPPCGSNTYLLRSAEELVIIDTGYAVYHEEWLQAVCGLVRDYDALEKRVYVTHADVDHCGLLALLGLPVYLNRKTADGLYRQYLGISDYRETKEYHFGYSKLNRIISRYVPYDARQAVILDENTPEDHESFLPVGRIGIADACFEVLEGAGGHLHGECVLLSRALKVVFTGDILVNIQGFSEQSAQFNAFAPYLMRSVNVDSQRATQMRQELTDMLDPSYLVCGGHGPAFHVG